MAWSFSKLETYLSCPYAYYLTYCQGEHPEGPGNAFSDYGTFAHQLLEKWAKGELEKWQLPMEWDIGYDAAIQNEFPPFMKGYREKAKAMAASYFASFDGFPGWDIVSAERRFTTMIGAYEFAGIADLVLRSRDTGKLMVVDHKTKSTDAMRKDIDRYRNQLYIYAAHCRDQYGEWPETLAFNMIKTGDLIAEPFREEQMEKTVRWAADAIENIVFDTEFTFKQDDFHCRFLCDVRTQCVHCPIYVR